MNNYRVGWLLTVVFFTVNVKLVGQLACSDCVFLFSLATGFALVLWWKLWGKLGNTIQYILKRLNALSDREHDTTRQVRPVSLVWHSSLLWVLPCQASSPQLNVFNLGREPSQRLANQRAAFTGQKAESSMHTYTRTQSYIIYAQHT